MKRKGTIVELYRFKEVTFYTFLFDDEEIPMGMDFLKKNKSNIHFNVLMKWIKIIGEKRSAVEYYFRKERAASALPPPINITNTACSLRWYCLRLRPTAVILFNGGIKTTQLAQDCPNVRGHFALANVLSEAIWKAVESKEILFDVNDRISHESNLKITV